MKFTPATIGGAWIIDMERHEDERGWFARTWCAEEFAKHGLNPNLPQCSASFNQRRGTLRGMHFQVAPHEEAKLVRCTRGAIFDVAVDLRVLSPSFKQWVGVELTQDNGRAFYIPEGCAHGFQTLEDNTELLYMISAAHSAKHSQGVRWNDPLIAISWPLPECAIINDRDLSFQDFHASQST